MQKARVEREYFVNYWRHYKRSLGFFQRKEPRQQQKTVFYTLYSDKARI